jgi:sugar phosphate isomerase/epimerase
MNEGVSRPQEPRDLSGREASSGPRDLSGREASSDPRDLSGRLGADVPKGWWPTPPMLKGLEAAGFGWVQARTPPRSMLCDRERLLRHAGALRRTLETCGLDLVLHGPDDLSAGDPAHDRALDGLLDYAAATGARYVVYHGAHFPAAADPGAIAAVRDREAREEESLRARVPRLERLGVTLAIENLAPVHPGPPRLCHDPVHVRDLVLALASPRVGMLFDVGHANIVAGLHGTDVRALLEPVLEAVVLFHLHDNLGARGDRGTAPGLDPLRLDLHLAPGAGRLSWGVVAPLMLSRPVPLVLEVHPPHRPEPLRLASDTVELLVRDRPRVGGARSAVHRGRPREGLTVPLG